MARPPYRWRVPDASPLLDGLFRHTFGRLPYYRTHAEGVELLGDSEVIVRNEIRRYREAIAAGSNRTPTFLDVGARNAVRADFARGYAYHAIDVTPQAAEVIVADICRCPQIPDGRFDVVFSFDVFEHLKRPWDAALECLRITRPGGLLVHRSLFAYRYHPEPQDFWRYSAQCLEYLFTDSGQADTIVKGYDVRGRRRDRRGVFADHKPPVDWLGGFRENWQVLWIGRKRAPDATP